MTIIEIRKMVITFINKSLGTRQIEKKMATWLKITKTKKEVVRPKKKKKRERENYTKSYFFFIVISPGA